MLQSRKDLFVATFERFSESDLETYFARFIKLLPFRLLKPAIEVNPQIQRLAGFAELYELLRSDFTCWRNPELYPYLNYLNCPDSRLVAESVRALRIHTGLDSLSLEAAQCRSVWRLRAGNHRVFRVDDRCVTAIDDILVDTGNPSTPSIYRPYPNLFDDLRVDLYHWHGRSCRAGEAEGYIEQAFRLIDRYSPSLKENVCTVLNTIALMPYDAELARSFTLRNFYIGGAFVSIDDPISLSEQIIHEYYHQCIWPWWLIEKPDDLPGDHVRVVSPVTGRARPLNTMIQALLIYRSLIDFYEWVGATFNTDEVGLSAAEGRLVALKRNLEPLVSLLSDATRQMRATREIIEFLAHTSIGSDQQYAG
ncbi:HEXXH motif-containing putative peptide modification protein [Bradyrhizobium sp. RP6]|uniref:HEXXH motif-containing putative peptide modification protein n=1 Tax=Bradyrhizobium sp. RP6 TaxID=2489596 RepID=UPI000F51F02F|nr:HEXXH motif-containing putative peptide modification protein [Bradyrhizobium sp. RP6]RQH12657.1 hypothetical protein EHH60_14290 [Bradyrhizobium sp. RP6]